MTPGRPSAKRGRPLFVVLRLTLVGLITAVVTLAAYMKVAGIPVGQTGPPTPFRGNLEEIIHAPTSIPVLFIGNSLTSSNSMPHMLGELAAHAPDQVPILTYTYAPAAGWLGQALNDSDLQRLVHQVPWWSYVVLQEDSHVSDLKDWAAYSDIDGSNIASDQFLPTARPVVFETWAYRQGYPYAYASDTYARMQERLQYAAQQLQGATAGQLAPVGYAFSRALATVPGVGLWGRDGMRPSRAGSYLAAAVLYYAIGGRFARASTYNAGLSPTLAGRLRQLARSVVLHARRLSGVDIPILPAIRGDPWSAFSRRQCGTDSRNPCRLP